MIMAPDGLPRRHVPFGGHQVAEYALAAALAVVGLHLTGRPELVLVVSGGVLALFAIVSKGPLAAWRVVPRRVHLYLDLPLAACFALSPVLYVPSFPLIPIIISEAVAVVLVRMSLTTEIVARPRVPSAGRGARRPEAASAGPAPMTLPPQGATSRALTLSLLLLQPPGASWARRSRRPEGPLPRSRRPAGWGAQPVMLAASVVLRRRASQPPLLPGPEACRRGLLSPLSDLRLGSLRFRRRVLD